MRLLGALALLLMAVLGRAVEPITLRFSVWDGDESLRVIKRILARFERENPDIKVKLENYSDYGLYHQKMLVTYAAHTAPDVAMMDFGHFQALARRGALLPLNDFMAKTPGFDIGAYYQPIVDSHTFQGKLYVLPRDIAPQGIIYYNKKAFDAAGIPYPDGTWTWDYRIRPELKDKDFLWVVDRLTQRGANGKVTRYGFASGWPGQFMDTFGYSVGARYADNPEKATRVTLDDPRWAKTLAFYKDVTAKGWVPSSTEMTAVLQQNATQLFVAGKIAMYQNGIWEVPNIRRDMKPGSKDFFEWDITAFPAHASGTRGAPTGGSGYSIFSSTKYPEAAWRLTRYMSGPVGMNAMAAAGIAQPAIRKLALSPPWTVGPNTPLEQRHPPSREVLDDAVDHVVFPPTDELWTEVASVYSGRVSAIYDGITPIEEGLRLGDEEAQRRLDTLRREERLPEFPWGVGVAVAAFLVAGVLWAIYWPERNVRYTHREREENRSAYRFLTPWLIGLVVFTVGPMLLSLLMAFMNWDMIRPAQYRGLGNFHEMVAEDPRFWTSLRVTLIYTLVATPLGLLVALLLALLLNQKVRGVPLFRAMYYIPSIASAVALTLVFRKILAQDDGLVNHLLYKTVLQDWFRLGDFFSQLSVDPTKPVNWLGSPKTALAAVIGMSLLGAGGGMVVLLAGLQGIPQYYYEAATVDGATPFQRLRAITLPLLTPAIFFSLITGFIGSFQVFTQVFIITGGANGGPDNSLFVFMMAIWSAAFTNLRMGYAAALGWVLFAIVLLFTLMQLGLMKRFAHYEADVK